MELLAKMEELVSAEDGGLNGVEFEDGKPHPHTR
jgi:hypothetical protein